MIIVPYRSLFPCPLTYSYTCGLVGWSGFPSNSFADIADWGLCMQLFRLPVRFPWKHGILILFMCHIHCAIRRVTLWLEIVRFYPLLKWLWLSDTLQQPLCTKCRFLRDVRHLIEHHVKFWPYTLSKAFRKSVYKSTTEPQTRASLTKYCQPHITFTCVLKSYLESIVDSQSHCWQDGLTIA